MNPRQIILCKYLQIRGKAKEWVGKRASKRVSFRAKPRNLKRSLQPDFSASLEMTLQIELSPARVLKMAIHRICKYLQMRRKALFEYFR